ncbi:tRNA pseudouridine synthase-like 1 [Trichonephila clavata]|uniref:tRNA pseudouridine synthase n=1 Tax=Trichonephila clavata TaxID=2740835 RepID=A0A8X6FVL9_TRICU|nr:tRNA pseudouridine synthase-like 1 [Trichonephila clavata]
MVKYFFRLGYIGTKYRGIQKLIDKPLETIQGAVESALLKLKLQNYPKTTFASRTDKGVHALMNAFHVDLNHSMPGEVYQPHHIKKVLNSYFIENDDEIIVTSACVVPETFHARFNCKWRSYYYRLAILNPEIRNASIANSQGYIPVCEMNRCYAVPSELNTSMVKTVADMYCGEHDFSTFTKYISREPWKGTTRIIEECQFYESSNSHFMNDPQYSNISTWEFYIKSQSFLYRQVRKLVGTAVSVGLGKLSLSDVKGMFENPNPENWQKCVLPSPGGLYLAQLHYDKEDFLRNDVPVLSSEIEEIAEKSQIQHA